MINRMNTDTCSFDYFVEYVHYFWMITWIKNVNNFQIAKVQPQGILSICLIFFSVLYKQHFYNTFNARLKLKKNQANAKDTLRLNFCYLKIIRILHLRYHPKIVGRF